MKTNDQFAAMGPRRRAYRIVVVTIFTGIIAGIIWVLLIPTSVPLPVPDSTTDNSMGITILGKRDFVIQVKSALTLLRDKDPTAFKIVKKYIGIIQESTDISEMLANVNPPVFLLTHKSASYSVTWCASGIAHDSYHSKLYNDYRTKIFPIVPPWIWKGESAEKQCLQYQLPIMKAIGSPESEMAPIRSGNTSYMDRTHD